LALDESAKQLLIKTASGWPSEMMARRTVAVRPGGRLEFVLSRREPLITEDLAKDERFSDSPLVRLGVRSGIQVPIFGTAGTFGILSAHARAERQFGLDDASFLQSVANILAVPIERRRAEERRAGLAQCADVGGRVHRH